jgi:hypothetical protein
MVGLALLSSSPKGSYTGTHFVITYIFRQSLTTLCLHISICLYFTTSFLSTTEELQSICFALIGSCSMDPHFNFKEEKMCVTPSVELSLKGSYHIWLTFNIWKVHVW